MGGGKRLSPAFSSFGPVKEKNGVMAQTVELSLEGSYFEILVFLNSLSKKDKACTRRKPS